MFEAAAAAAAAEEECTSLVRSGIVLVASTPTVTAERAREIGVLL